MKLSTASLFAFGAVSVLTTGLSPAAADVADYQDSSGVSLLDAEIPGLENGYADERALTEDPGPAPNFGYQTQELETVTVDQGGNLLSFSVSPVIGGTGSGLGPSAGQNPSAEMGLAMETGNPGLLYFTPRVTNFDLGLGRTGETCKFISPEIAGASCYAYDQIEAEDADPEETDRLAIGLAYQKKVRDVDLGVSSTVVAGATDSDGLSPAVIDLQSWKLDFSAGYTGFTFSTSYYEDRARGDGKRDKYSGLSGQEVFDLGVKYDQGPWAFGVQYSHSQLDALSIGPTLNDQQVDAYEIGGSYLMGPRLSLGAAIQFWKWDEVAGTTIEEDQNSDLLFLVGSHLKF